MVCELVLWISRHGERPPSRDSENIVFQRTEAELASWITSINRRRNDPGFLSSEQREILKEVRFPFTISHDESWMHSYNLLKNYAGEHGNCDVPQRDPELGSWVAEQRRQFKLKLASLTDERVLKLDSIGFSWSVKKDPESAWNDQFTALVRFKNLNGHLDVTSSTMFEGTLKLANWVKKQRHQYRLRIDNKKSSMNDSRIDSLNEVGFVWVP